MSTAEPFMPAHEPPAPVPPTERDIDHDVDVIFDPPAEGTEEAPWEHDDSAPVFPRPVPGDHVTRQELEDDLDG